VAQSNPISIEYRMQLSAIADRLVFGDPSTFVPDDALNLAGLLLNAPNQGLLARLLPDVRVRASLPDMTLTGFAAGAGNVSIGGDHTSFDLDIRGRRVVRAGQWKLCRAGSSIEIEQVMADEMDDGRTARVEYKRGNPVRMSLLVTNEITIGPLALARARFRPWKLPA
jgi:hypothetical protein